MRLLTQRNARPTRTKKAYAKCISHLTGAAFNHHRFAIASIKKYNALVRGKVDSLISVQATRRKEGKTLAFIWIYNGSYSVLEEWVVDKIIGSRFVQKNGNNFCLQYLVKWSGLDASESTWEPLQNVCNAQRLVEEFHANNTNAPKPYANVTKNQYRVKKIFEIQSGGKMGIYFTSELENRKELIKFAKVFPSLSLKRTISEHLL